MTYFDIHTHHPGRQNAIINLNRGQEPQPGFLYSIGLHPWDTSLPPAEIESQLALTGKLAESPLIATIGEAGLDALRGSSLERQTELLLPQIAISERVAKPLLLHIVKAWQQIINLHTRINPTQPWIIHGFRGKPELARRLIGHGFYISLGQHHNPRTADIIPPSRLFVETDESTATIDQIASTLTQKPLSFDDLSKKCWHY